MTQQTFDTQALIQQDTRYTLHPWANLKTASTEGDLVMTDGDGYHVFDSEGRKYIDGIAGMWCVNLGYGNEEIADALAEQARKLVYYTPFGAMTNPVSSELAAVLAELSPGDLNRVHFTTSGSESVDSAIRFVHYYFSALGKPEKRHIISRKDSYHGSTYLSASLSGKAVDRTYFEYMEETVHHVSSPNSYRREKGLSVEEFCNNLVQELEDTILKIGPDQVACFIAEPILGSGGVLVPPEGYHKRTLEVCRKYDVLYISDEVVTGFGRLGHFFSSEEVWGIVPDIITCAKGLSSGYQPLGAVLISDRLFEAISGENARENPCFTNGYTYSGHPVACAAGLKNIEIMKRDKICEHVRDIGPYFMEQLKTLERFDIVGEVRGNHLMACVECNISGNPYAAEDVDMQAAGIVDKHCDAMGLIVRPYEALCILSPPLIIDKQGVDTLVSILAQSIEKATADLAAQGLLNKGAA